MEDHGECKKKIMAVDDAMYMIGGKWKLHIVAALYFGSKRYSDLLGSIEGISGKMLSRELKEMEMNHLVTRVIIDTRPIGVEYSLTDHGLSLLPLIDQLATWGLQHKMKILEADAVEV